MFVCCWVFFAFFVVVVVVVFLGGEAKQKVVGKVGVGRRIVNLLLKPGVVLPGKSTVAREGKGGLFCDR